MKIIKFIKKNYKRLIIQVVSIISALVIFSVPAFAESTLKLNTVNLWCTDFSVRSGNFSNDNWGSVVETWNMQHLPYYPPYSDITNTDEHTGLCVRYPYEDNSIELKDKYLVSTWQLYDDSVQILSGHVYTINIPLVFIMETNKTIITDFIKFSFWDRNNSSTPYYNAISNERLTWRPTHQDGYYELLYTVTLKNYSDVTIIPNYIRLAIGIDTTLKFWQGNEFGFSNYITIEDMGEIELYKTVDNSSLMLYGDIEKDILNSTAQGREDAMKVMDFSSGDTNFINGMLAVTNILTPFLELPPFRNLGTFSLSLGIAAFLLGIFATWGAVSSKAQRQGYRDGVRDERVRNAEKGSDK